MHSDAPLRYTIRIMAEHLASEPLAPPAATAPPMLAVECPDVADAPSPAPLPDPAAIARDVTARLTPLIDRALQRAVAPLAHTIAQQTATIDRLATALHALQVALPKPVALEMAPDAPTRHPHALQAYQDAQDDMANREDAQRDSTEREDTPDRRVADRRTRDAVWTAPDRRVADRRAQQDRDRFEDAVLAQYVPPPPPPPPPPAAALPHPPSDTPPASSAPQGPPAA